MFVTKKKYEKLKRKYKYMKEQKQFGDIIEFELRKELERVNKQLEDIYENSFDYDELMTLLHEKYTKKQATQMIKTVIHNNGL